MVRCSSTREIPKLELFSSGKFDRIIQNPPLIEKAEIELSGTLEKSYIICDNFFFNLTTFYVLLLDVLSKKIFMRECEISVEAG